MRKKMCEDAKSASDQKEAELLEEWEKQWKATLEDVHVDYFFTLFSKVYMQVLHSKNENKRKNECYKKRYLGILLAGGVVYRLLLVGSLYKGNDRLSFLLESGLLLIILIFFSSLMSKWIDIKKYQETWARHSWHLHMMEMEMLRFISKIAPYDDNTGSKELFMKRVLEIWNRNQDK